MSETAFQTQYRDEFIAGFEVRQSLLRSTVTTEAVIKGNTATFLVADSGGAAAVTRGVNGLIPARADNLTQASATLAEWHDLVRKSGFNVFASQGDQKRIMQMTTMAVINRKIDADIIAQLDTATHAVAAAAQILTVNTTAKALAILGNAKVDLTDTENIFGLITPAGWAYMMQAKEAGNGMYVDVKPFAGPIRRMWRWFGVNWVMHPALTGVNTSSEKCYLYHRTALGQAVNTADIQSPVGYDQEQDYSWARASIFMGSKLLQNTGVVQFLHDGSGMTGT